MTTQEPLAEPAEPLIEFRRGDKDLESRLHDLIGTRLEFMNGHVPDQDIVKAQKILANHLKMHFISGHNQRLVLHSPMVDFAGKAQSFQDTMRWTAPETSVIACDAPVMLTLNAQPMAKKWAAFQKQTRISPASFRALLKNQYGAQALIRSSQEKLLRIPDDPGLLGRDAIGNKLHEDDAEGAILTADDWLQRIKKRPGLMLHEAEITTKLSRLSQYYEGPLNAILGGQYMQLPPAQRAYRAMLTDSWKKAPQLGIQDPATIIYNIDMVPQLAEENVLPKAGYTQAALKNGVLATISPEMVASKAVLLAAGVDLGLLPKDDPADPYSKLQHYVLKSSDRLGWGSKNLALRLVIGSVHGNAFFHQSTFDAETILTMAKTGKESVKNFNLLTLALKDVETRFGQLYPGVDPYEWTKQQTDVLTEIDTHTREKHFSLNFDTLSMQLLPTSPHFAKVMAHNADMKQKKSSKKNAFAENGGDVASVPPVASPAPSAFVPGL